jgi:uncharacterized DUF497 family protein
VLIVEFEWDDDIEEKLGKRGIVKEDLDAMLQDRITVRRNKRSGSGDYQIRGRGVGGKHVRLVVARTSVPGRWTPVTGLPDQ